MKKFKNKKHIALSLVALVLVMLMTVGVTYSWIDDIKQVEISTNQNGEKAPLKTGVDINSDINITKDESTINLGNLLTKNDLEYDYTDDKGNEKSHTKYEHSQTNGERDPNWSDINAKKGYFYESGDMHLSGCYSDGETFYFPTSGNNGYREGNKDDENVNYISFTAKVSSPNANVDFWFESLPSIYKHGTNTEIENARYAINVDGQTHVYSSTGEAKTINNTNVSGVRETSVYTFNNEDNTTSDRGKNSNILFSIKKGDTVNLNVKIWVEGELDADITSSDIVFNMVSSWAYTRSITIVDQTSSCKYISNSSTNSSWLGNENLYLVLPDVLTEMCAELYATPTISKWANITGNDGYEDAPFYSLRANNSNIERGTTSDGFAYFKIKKVPLVYNNEKMMLFRTQNGWNTGNYTTNSTNYGVKCYNWWRSSLPNTYIGATYRLYGGSHDNYASRYFDNTVDNKYKTYQGYGTWGSLVKIEVDGRTKAKTTVKESTKTANDSTDLAIKQNNSDSIDMYICDYTDKDTSGEVYIHGMSYAQSNNCWFAYVPESSDKLQFYYHRNNGEEQGWWGYNSWSGDNPQQRPLNSYKYYFTHRIAHPSDDSNHDGIGYWDGDDKVYLLRNGNISDSNLQSLKAYLYRNAGNDDYEYNSPNGYGGYPGAIMTATGQNDPRDNATPIYQISTVFNSNSAYHHYIQFSGVWSDNTLGGRRKLPLCPGCYFDWQNNKWLGSLSGSGRSAASSSGSGGSSGGSSGTTETMTISTSMDGAGVYLYGALDGTGTHEQLAKMTNTSGNTYTGNLTLTASSNNTLYYIRVREATDSQHWTHYQDTNSYLVLESNMGTRDYTLRSTNSQPLYLRVEDTNTYKFTYDKSQHKITITLA